MDSQDPRFTTPPPYYGNLYDAETPPSAQPRSPLEIPESQQTTQSWDSRNSPRPQINESQPIDSWGSRDLLPDSQLLPDSLLNESIPSPPLFVPDSQADSSQELSQGTNHRHYTCAPQTSRDLRLQIQTALLFRIPHAEIKQVLDVTDHQIWYAKNHRPTPQKGAGKPHNIALHTPEKEKLKKWLLESPSHRHVAYHKMSRHLPQLHAKEKAFRTAIQDISYCRRVSRKKGYSDDPEVIQERLDLAEQGSTWPRPYVQRICFTDEVWAFGGAHTSSYITCLQDGSDRLLPECVRHKYSKLPSWMFWGCIVDGKKGPSLFWEKEWGSINSARYDERILSLMEQFLRNHPLSRYRFWQDNASSHRSYETKTNLLIRHIPTIQAPRYSPDLNLIEHVWNWMKNWIEEHYWQARYDPAKIHLDQLRRIVQDAWEAVPDEYIQGLYDSWWRRCEAVKEAKGGPTKY
jgi:DDE superfamily endonuclease